MKIAQRFWTSIFAFLLVLAFSLPTDALASHKQVTYQWLIGAQFIHGPVISMNREGDTVEITGEGTMTIRPKSITGGGTFVHKRSDGSIVGQGTWTAERLLSFRSFGNGVPQGAPENFEGGRAWIRVELTATDGTEFDGLLKVECLLGDKIPKSAEEGVELFVPGPNFRDNISGETLFIRTD